MTNLQEVHIFKSNPSEVLPDELFACARQSRKMFLKFEVSINPLTTPVALLPTALQFLKILLLAVFKRSKPIVLVVAAVGLFSRA